MGSERKRELCHRRILQWNGSKREKASIALDQEKGQRDQAVKVVLLRFYGIRTMFIEIEGTKTSLKDAAGLDTIVHHETRTGRGSRNKEQSAKVFCIVGKSLKVKR